MCWQVEQAGHTGVCLGCGITVNISITRSVGYGICCFLFPSPKCSVTDPARRWEDTALQVSPHATASRCYTTGIDSSCFWRRFSRYATALTRGSWRLCATLWLLISMPPCSGVFSFSTTHLVWVSLSGVNILNRVKGSRLGYRGAFHSKDESFIFIPYQHPRHECSSFWWWCQSNHSYPVVEKEVRRSAAQPTLDECLRDKAVGFLAAVSQYMFYPRLQALSLLML